MSTKAFYESLEELRMLFPLISSFFFNIKIEFLDLSNEKNFLACITKSKFLEKEEKSKEKYTLLVNRAMLEKFDTKVISGVILHEILHIALSHLNMLENRYLSEIEKDPNLRKIWNICVDYPINEIIRSFGNTLSLPENSVSFKTLKELALILDVPLNLVEEGETSIYYYELFRDYYLKKKKEEEQGKGKGKGEGKGEEKGEEKREGEGKGKGEGEEKRGEEKEKGKEGGEGEKEKEKREGEGKGKEKGKEKEKGEGEGEGEDILDKKISELYERTKLNDNHESFTEKEDEDSKNKEGQKEENFDKSDADFRHTKDFEEERIKTWKEQFLKDIAKKIEEISQKQQKTQGHGSYGAVLKFLQKIFAFKVTIPNADEKIKQSLLTLNYEERENKSTIHPKTFLPLSYNEKTNLLPVYHKKRKKTFPTNVIFAFDTSGSMSSQDVLMGLSGTFDLLRKLQKKCHDDNVSFQIKHIEFDYEICGKIKNFDKVEDYINFLINKEDYSGGGGTLYKPVLEYFFSDSSLKGKNYLFIFTDGEEADIKHDLPEIFKKYKHVHNRFIFFVLTPNGTESFLREAISNLSSHDRNKVCLTRLQTKKTKTQSNFLIPSENSERKFSFSKKI